MRSRRLFQPVGRVGLASDWLALTPCRAIRQSREGHRLHRTRQISVLRAGLDWRLENLKSLDQLRHPSPCSPLPASTPGAVQLKSRHKTDVPSADNKWLVGFVSQKLSLFDFGTSQNKPLIGIAL